MTTKEYLSQLNRLETIIEQKKEQLNELKQLTNTIKSTDYSKEIVDSSKDNNVKFIYDVEKIYLLEQEIKNLLDNYFEIKYSIINQIHSLDNVNYIKILFQRYVENKSFREIACNLSYDYTYILSLHGKAIAQLE